MSLTISSPEQIRDNPLNTSTSKHLYSFSKYPRFPNDTRINCSSAFYNLPDSKEKRTSGFGYGTKLDFTKHNTVTPSPNAYSIKSIFEKSKSNNKGISFGYGREELWQNGIIPKSKPGPGPCKYKLPDELSKVSYTIGTRTPINNKLTFLQSPGPGTYPSVSTITSNGQYFLSKYAGSQAALFNPSSSSRFTNFSTIKNNPGPGTYQPKTELKIGGQYHISKFQSTLGKSFPLAKRSQTQLPSYENPGPGSYRIPSDFGYYETKASTNREKTEQS